MLEGVVAGDRLLVHCKFEDKVMTVTRTTSTLAVCGPYRFRKDNGELFGKCGRGHMTARPMTEEADLERRERWERQRLIQEIRKTKLEAFSVRKLKRILKTIADEEAVQSVSAPEIVPPECEKELRKRVRHLPKQERKKTGFTRRVKKQ